MLKIYRPRRYWCTNLQVNQMLVKLDRVFDKNELMKEGIHNNASLSGERCDTEPGILTVDLMQWLFNIRK